MKQNPDEKLFWDPIYGKVTLLDALEDIVKQHNFENYELYALALYYRDIQAYFSNKQERYKYTSDNACPMLVDFNYFKQLNISYFPKIKINEFEISIPPSKNISEKNKKEFLKFVDRNNRSYGDNIAKRINLNQNPEKKELKKKVNTIQKESEKFRLISNDEKEVIRNLASKGHKPHEIRELFEDDPTVNPKSINSICAWVKIKQKKAA